MRDKEERETEVVMEEGDVVMEVKWVTVAEVDVDGGKKFLVKVEVEDVSGEQVGVMCRYFQM